MSALLTKTVCAQSQIVIDTTCIKTEQLRKLVIDARKSKIQDKQIENLKTRLLNDSLIIRNDSILIDNKTQEIERKAVKIDELNAEIKKEKVKAGIWKATSGILGLVTLRLIFKQ